MKPSSQFTKRVLLVLVVGLLAACNQEGVAGFSPNNNRVAVVHKVASDIRLYTTDNNGGGPVKIEDNIIPGFDVTFDPLGQKLLYATGGQICTSDVVGGGKACPVNLPAGVSGGFLAFLPSGDYIFVYSSGGKSQMYIYQPGAGAPSQSELNVDNFFMTTDAYKVRRGTNGVQWFLTQYDKPAGQQNLRWVIVRGTQAIMYNAAGSLQGPTALPREINTAVSNALKDRDQSDITSGAISPDGTKMVFRTRTGTDPNFNYSLYALDLAVNTGSFIPLVNNANFRIQFAFSPTGQELVYESNDGGRSVWLANSDGTNPRKLSDNASLPNWQ
jgi:Tol biopolymer transport system component